MVPYPAALDLPHALVEWVTMLIVTREGDRRCKLRPSQRAIIALVFGMAGAAVFLVAYSYFLWTVRPKADEDGGKVPVDAEGE